MKATNQELILRSRFDNYSVNMISEQDFVGIVYVDDPVM